MIILLTNDDGVYAPGLQALKEALEGLGDLWVVAPAGEQSGVSHGFSLSGPLRVEEVIWNGHRFGLAVNGTPVDAVKLAIRALLPEPPGLVVSGINRGENSGVDLLYSGTVAGAMEGALLGFPAVAISQSLRIPGPHGESRPIPPSGREAWSRRKVDYTAAAHYARIVCEAVIKRDLPAGRLLNVNVPLLHMNDIKGLRVTPQADSYYEESLERRHDPRGVGYYWSSWKKAERDHGNDSDVSYLKDGYVTITPVAPKLTDEALLAPVAEWFKS
ncbi:MAG: 5'/3'-nucleotidase SurE [Calditrichaeota bacterium]|nr:5'/3'-nucleotidase SurE [Calditrichota bacterium]